jgi:cytochrome P450
MTVQDAGSSAAHVGEVSSAGDALAHFAWLRENAPVNVTADGAYVLSRYEDVYEALRAPQTFSSQLRVGRCEIPPANQRLVVYADDPDHFNLRQLVNKAWTPSSVARLETLVRQNVTEAVNALEPGVEFDAVPLGSRVARRAFADAVGLPPAERNRVNMWFDTAVFFSQPSAPDLTDASLTESERLQRRQRFEQGYRDLRSYLEDLVAAHEEHELSYCRNSERLLPFPYVVVRAARLRANALDELVHRVMPSIILGGASTVSHMYANALDVLIDHPRAWQQLRAQPGRLDPGAPSEHLEEIMRLRGVVQGIPRVATRDVTVGGTTIPAGSRVLLWYLSGSHDEQAFECPEEFRLRGGTSRHLGFGFGTHTCMGQSFARLQLRLFLQAMVARFAEIERVGERAPYPGVGSYYTPQELWLIGRE